MKKKARYRSGRSCGWLQCDGGQVVTEGVDSWVTFWEALSPLLRHVPGGDEDQCKTKDKTVMYRVMGIRIKDSESKHGSGLFASAVQQGGWRECLRLARHSITHTPQQGARHSRGHFSIAAFCVSLFYCVGALQPNRHMQMRAMSLPVPVPPTHQRGSRLSSSHLGRHSSTLPYQYVCVCTPIASRGSHCRDASAARARLLQGTLVSRLHVSLGEPVMTEGHYCPALGHSINNRVGEERQSPVVLTVSAAIGFVPWDTGEQCGASDSDLQRRPSLPAAVGVSTFSTSTSSRSLARAQRQNLPLIPLPPAMSLSPSTFRCV